MPAAPDRYLRKLTAQQRAFLDPRGRPGVLVVYDIVDSTKRKRTARSWLYDTAVVYAGFRRWVRDLAQRPGVRERPHVKLIGDALMVFVPLDAPADASLRLDVLTCVQAFRTEVHLDPRDLLDGVRLKTVVVALRGVRDVGGERLGLGVDFAFRLEKVGAPDRVVVNEAFAEGLDARVLAKLGLAATRGALSGAKGFGPVEPFVAFRDR